MNKVILMGRLTADPELRQTPTGVAVTSFTIAVDRRFQKEGLKQTDFIRCTAWRQQSEFICKYFRKGSMICVIGNIQTRSWEGQDGKKQYTTDIVVEEIYFTGEKKSAEEKNTAYSDAQPSLDDFSQVFDMLGEECPF